MIILLVSICLCIVKTYQPNNHEIFDTDSNTYPKIMHAVIMHVCY